MTILQGDAYHIPVELLAEGKPVDDTLFDEVEITLGSLRKTMTAGEISYDREAKAFLFPITQQESFALPSGTAEAQARVKPKDTQRVIGVSLGTVEVAYGHSREVL